MKITKEWIDRAKRSGACEDAIDWLEEKERTLEELVDERPAWALFAAGRIEGATDLIPHEILDWCAAQAPYSALKCAKDLLTKERIAWCREQTAPGRGY